MLAPTPAGEVEWRPFEPGLRAFCELITNEPVARPVEALGNASFERLVSGFDSASHPSDFGNIAMELVRDKFALDAPELAAAGGLYLLKVGAIAKVRDWPRNVADYFPWLPDGPVVEGWRRLFSGEEANPPYPDWRLRDPPPPREGWPDPEWPRPDDPFVDAALRFCEAAERGPPVFALALSWLRDGLGMCARQRPVRTDDDLARRVSAAAGKVGDWSRHARPAGAVTAFAIPIEAVMPVHD